MPPLESSTNTTTTTTTTTPLPTPRTPLATMDPSSYSTTAPAPASAPPPPPSAKDTANSVVTVVNQVATDAAGRPGVYSGQWLPGPKLPHDPTTSACMVYDNSSSSSSSSSNQNTATSSTSASKKVLKYVGGWEYGHWHGRGTAWLVDGAVWTGDFCDDFMLNGWGRHDYSDGRSYQGQFVKGVRQGTGKYTWPTTGAVYEGSFSQNQRDGYGKYSDPSAGIEYAGEWKQGQYHGYGHYQWMDKVDKNSNTKKALHAYRGNFVAGKPHGQGLQVGPDGVVIHEGQWHHGKPVINEQQGVATTTPTGKRLSSSTGGSSSSSTPQQQPQRAVQVVHNQTWNDNVNNDNEWAVYRGLWNTQKQVPCKNGTAEYTSSSGDGSNSGSTGVGMTLRYEGCFNDVGQYHGQGRVQFRNGDVYEGEFVTGRRHGKGVYRWKDGRQYTGDFQNDARQGKGRLLYQNSDFYEGQFVQGKRHGSGRFIFANGSMYQGEWINGSYHGQGTLVQPDGSTYTGTFAKGVFHGSGKEIDASGKIVYQGEYIEGIHADEYEAKRKQKNSSTSSLTTAVETLDLTGSEPQLGGVVKSSALAAPNNNNHHHLQPHHGISRPRDEPPCEAVVDQEIRDCQGNPGRYTGIVMTETRKPHGVGRLVYADGKRIHEGFWKDGSKEGHGRCLFFPQGDFHEGEYKGNLRNGHGRYQWKDGRLYTGDYKEDQRHGKGSFSYPSGERYEGMFKRGQRNGFGKFTFKGGFYEGEWMAGKYHGQGHLVWDGTVYDGAFAEGTFHGRGIKKEAATGKILQQGTWNMGRFALAATPTKIQQQQQQPPPPEQEQTVQENGSASNLNVNVASPDDDSTPLKVTDEGVAVVVGEEDDIRLSVKALTLDASEMTLGDDSVHGVKEEVAGAISNGSNVQELDLTGDDDEKEGDDDDDQRAASSSLDHGDEPPVVSDGRDGADLPPSAD